ncbi:beta-glucosidase [Talaromyces islandicus]|uniref:xylan 1,4-beta-xylosidase n=1 Tax=Talaromyces islandicus TaxID=28573 RepID=A0A0U1LMH3_TALIS|nr:beta-glucosidase [Talaromyces islandicus]
MSTLKAVAVLLVSLIIRPCLTSQLFSNDFSFNPQYGIGEKDQDAEYDTRDLQKDAFLDTLVANMTVLELALQLQLMFADSIIGPNSDNALWDERMHLAPSATIGFMHDWYPTNKSQYNDMQRLNTRKSRIDIPILQTGECLHGVGSFKQSMFPQSIGMAASFDTGLVHRVGRAIGEEASSIGIRACFAPVLDLGKDPRWGRAQEAWGEDMVLTSYMGVAYASGLSKNSTWSDPDAVVPVMKHFAAHGSPQAGHNAAPFMGYGVRQVLQEMLVPFKAVVDLGGAKGVMMAYSEFDDVPCSVNPILYKALNDWGFDGYITADDTGLEEFLSTHMVTSSIGDTLTQWFNAGGMVQYYDFPLDTFLTTIENLVNNGTLQKSTLQSRAKRVLGVKYDLGLFNNRFIADDIDSDAITQSHIPLALEAAQKSIVLLENRNSTLPLVPSEQRVKQIALVGPFVDIFNYGDCSGQFGGYPVQHASTIRQAVSKYLAENAPDTEMVTSWGGNSWTYNGQYNIPSYLLSANGTSGGLRATYYANPDFTEPKFQKIETPTLDWGLYPPSGLPSNNFSVIWEGNLTSPVDLDVDGWLGVAVYANTTSKIYIDGTLFVEAEKSTSGNLLSNIPGIEYSAVNGTVGPPGSVPFTFRKGAVHQIRVEYQAWNYHQKIENMNSLNAQIILFWNLVDRNDPVGQAVNLAKSSDVIILAVGANWNSDGESADRATLSLSSDQTALADAIYALGKPVILVLEGGRPFAIPDYYSKSAAFFGGQAAGQAISDTIFGVVNPGGRVPLSVPYDVGTIPVYYNYKPSFPRNYTDIQSTAIYPFGYGLSYTTFQVSNFTAHVSDNNSSSKTFSNSSTIQFTCQIQNNGTRSGSYVAQVYLLSRGSSSITRPVRQLVTFSRVYLNPTESMQVEMYVEVSRYLTVLDRGYEWTVEAGEYTFALMENGGETASTGMNVTLTMG